MRPRLAPRAFGVTYWHIAYRLQVRAAVIDGTAIGGLYFLRSDVDRPLFVAAGNRLTDFKFHRADVQFRCEPERWCLQVNEPNGPGTAMLCLHRATSAELEPGSPFSSIEERERVLKYAPFGLSTSSSGRHLRIAEVIRDEALWKEEPIGVETAAWTYTESLGLTNLKLVRATRVAPIDYIWRLGRIESMRSPAKV
jgi:hypothetical protein